MPFMDVERPSIQLGLLKAIGMAHGFPVRTLHANLDFAVQIGVPNYRTLTQHDSRTLGEWLFSSEAFPADAPDRSGRLADEWLHEIPGTVESRTTLRGWLLQVKQLDVPKYLDSLLERFAWDDVRVVGFSSTFQQNTASFALARRLKERYPDIITVFGGANFDGDMGLEFVRTLDFIDMAVIGEGDRAFPGLLSALASGADPTSVPGVARRSDGQVVATPPEPPFDRLDELPTPDYGEYFERAEGLGVIPASARRSVWIPMETSRGCWWGAKHHCTFCGLNGLTMSYRSKSVGRVLDEMGQLSRRYRSFSFEAVDNILDVGHLKDLFPAIVDSQADYQLFYEVKANLTRDQLRIMAQAGVSRIQPGIESLSSHVLGLMRKGVRAAQNVNVLRWAQYYGIHVSWNMLWGFQGETAEDYDRQAAAIPNLVHLQPPVGAGPIRMERFSPLFFESETFKFKSRAPERSYRYVYPEYIDLEKIAYFFDYELQECLPTDTYVELGRKVEEWSDAWSRPLRPTLKYWSAPGFLQIYDGRYPGKEGTYTFGREIAEIYLSCSDRPRNASAVREKLTRDMRVEEIQDVFEEFAARGLMFLDDSVAVALALPAVAGR
jgi:ribosomal peptide maturation radical SAM protein 1